MDIACSGEEFGAKGGAEGVEVIDDDAVLFHDPSGDLVVFLVVIPFFKKKRFYASSQRTPMPRKKKII